MRTTNVMSEGGVSRRLSENEKTRVLYSVRRQELMQRPGNKRWIVK